MMPDPIEIHIVADSTGDTAARVARATIAQFEAHEATILRHPRITTEADLRRAFGVIHRTPGHAVSVFATLVDDGLRALLDDLCAQAGVPHCDLLGPALAAVEAATGDRAEHVMARIVGVDRDYFKRVAAMEFAIRHDDGQFAAELPKADIVLIGVSRAGKTPLSMYLGYLGQKTANVPLVPRIKPPRQLFSVDRWRIVGLTIDPQRLATIRGRRLRAVGAAGSGSGYAALTDIYEELEEARQMHRHLGCPVIDTTNLALEEAAERVTELVSDRRRAARATRSRASRAESGARS
ncbi:MAG: pyruvate, water dikinase regulatory protein [Candidatus Dormibacteraceae bacterium]